MTHSRRDSEVQRTMAVTAYLEKYFDCVDAMPLDLQHHISQLREIERRTQGKLEEVRQLECELVRVVKEGRGGDVERCLGQLQRCMLFFREVGNNKLEVTSQLLDTVEGYSQQLNLKAKELDNPIHQRVLEHVARHPRDAGARIDNPLLLLAEGILDKPPSKRNSSSKRPRLSEKVGEEEGENHRDMPGRSRENSTSGGGQAVGGKPPKKKVKVKKKPTKDPGTPLLPSQMPTPDLSSQPIDPDEPTYCLCNQVSFGEMIGCDNEDCPIEWFHFQCVGLTSKPKGKWYCPRCTQEKKCKNSK